MQVLPDGVFLPGGTVDGATDHAKEVIPVDGFARGAEAAIVIVRVDRVAVGPRNLPTEDRALAVVGAGDLKELGEPVLVGWFGIGVEEYYPVAGRFPHAAVEDYAGDVFGGLDLKKLVRLKRLDDGNGLILGARIDVNELDLAHALLGMHHFESVLDQCTVVKRAHHDGNWSRHREFEFTNATSACGNV